MVDILGPSLTVLFIGFNPGTRSGEIGHHFAGRNNRFWTLLRDSGLTPTLLAAEEDARMLDLGFGLTNLVARATPGSNDLRAAEMKEGAEVLRAKIARWRPRFACYLGKGIYRWVAGGPLPFQYGLQDESVVAGVADFLAHSPSGRNAVPYSEKLEVFRRLAEAVAQARSGSR